MEKIKEEYLKTLTPKELKSYEIAKTHLGMTFQLEKSNGFKKWLKEKNDEKLASNSSN